MNKILWKDSKISFIEEKELNVFIEGKVIIDDNNSSCHTYIFNVLEDSNLLWNKFSLLKNDLKVVINLHDKARLNLNYAFIAKSDNHIDIEVNILGNNINSNVLVRGVTEEKGRVHITVNGKVQKGSKSNSLTENIRILKLNDEESIIKPNLEVDSNDIIATHNAVSANIKKAPLFYLMSKGISRNSSIKLIRNGFLISPIPDLDIDPYL